MRDREKRRYDMFVKADAFGNDYLKDLPPDSKGAGYRTALAVVIVQLDANKVMQAPPRFTAVEVQLDGLLLDLKAIAKTARAVAQDISGFADSFTIASQSPAGVLSAADAFIAALKKPGVLQHFIDHEASPNLVAGLEKDVATIRKAQSSLSGGTTSAVAKTKAIGLCVSEGIKLVNHLDAIVINKYERNAEVLRAWQTASHVERAPQHEEHDDGTHGTSSTEPNK